MAVSKNIKEKCGAGSLVYVEDVGWFTVESVAGARDRFDLWMGFATKAEIDEITKERCVKCYKTKSDVEPEIAKKGAGLAWQYKTWSSRDRAEQTKKMMDKKERKYPWDGIYIHGVKKYSEIK